MKWDYCVVENENRLNDLGRKGWELVTVVQQGDRLRFFFKKPSQSFKEQITEEQRDRIYGSLDSGEH